MIDRMSTDQIGAAPPISPATLVGSAPFISYAQNFEDVMLWRALRAVVGGRYIDIGAGEPDADSVTQAFYERGWHGVNVEPLLGPFTRLQATRPRDVNLNLAAGAVGGEVCLYVVGNETGLSTLDPDLASRHRAEGWEVTEKQTRVATLADICAAHGDRGEVHFLKIDAEGAELDVLKGADFSHWRPWIILLEAVDPIEQMPQHEAWETEVLTPAGYKCVWFDGLNRFYLAAEQEAKLAHAFRTPPNVFDNFIRSSEIELRNQLDASDRVIRSQIDEAQARVNSAQARVEEEQARVAAAEARADDAQAYTHAAQLQTSELLARVEQGQILLLAAEDRQAKLEAERFEAEKARDQAIAGQTAADAQIIALREELSRSMLERNAWAQELFETNRYAADLTVTRQRLLEELAHLRVHEAWRVTQVAAFENQERDLMRARQLEEQLLQELIPLRNEREKILADAAYNRLWLTAVERSSSWRLTRPMRATLRLLGRRGRS